jgi:hypothetical protein
MNGDAAVLLNPRLYWRKGINGPDVHFRHAAIERELIPRRSLDELDNA